MKNITFQSSFQNRELIASSQSKEQALLLVSGSNKEASNNHSFHSLRMAALPFFIGAVALLAPLTSLMAIPIESEGLPIERTFEEQERLLRAPQDQRTGLDSRMLRDSQEGVEVGTVPVRATTLSVLEEEPIESTADVRNQSSQNISSLPVEIDPLNTLDLSPEALQEQIADAKESEEFWRERQEWLSSVSEGIRENRLSKDALLTEINGLTADAEEAAESWAQEYNRYYDHIEQTEKNGNAVEGKQRESLLSLLDACSQTVRAAEETQKLSTSLIFANHQIPAYPLTSGTKRVDLRDLDKAQRAISEAPIHRRTSALDSSLLKAFIAGSSLTTAAASGMGEAFVEQGKKSFTEAIAQLCKDYPIETAGTLAAMGGGYYAWKYLFDRPAASSVASEGAGADPANNRDWSFVKVAQAAVSFAAIAFSPKVFHGVAQESNLYTSHYPSWHESRVEWVCKHFTQLPDSRSSFIYQKLYPLSTGYLNCSNEALIAEKATLKKQAEPKKKVEAAIGAWKNATKTADELAKTTKKLSKDNHASLEKQKEDYRSALEVYTKALVICEEAQKEAKKVKLETIELDDIIAETKKRIKFWAAHKDRIEAIEKDETLTASLLSNSFKAREANKRETAWKKIVNAFNDKVIRDFCSNDSKEEKERVYYLTMAKTYAAWWKARASEIKASEVLKSLDFVDLANMAKSKKLLDQVAQEYENTIAIVKTITNNEASNKLVYKLTSDAARAMRKKAELLMKHALDLEEKAPPSTSLTAAEASVIQDAFQATVKTYDVVIEKRQSVDKDTLELTTEKEKAEAKSLEWTTKTEKIKELGEAKERAEKLMEDALLSEKNVSLASSLTENQALAIETAFQEAGEAYTVAIKKAEDAAQDIAGLAAKKGEVEVKKAFWTDQVTDIQRKIAEKRIESEQKKLLLRQAKERAQVAKEEAERSMNDASSLESLNLANSSLLMEQEAFHMESLFHKTIGNYNRAIEKAQEAGLSVSELTEQRGKAEMKKAEWSDKANRLKRAAEEKVRLQNQKLEEVTGLQEKAERSMSTAESLEQEHAIDSPSLTKIQAGAMESLLDAAITDYTAAIEKAQEAGQSIADLTAKKAEAQAKKMLWKNKIVDLEAAASRRVEETKQEIIRLRKSSTEYSTNADDAHAAGKIEEGTRLNHAGLAFYNASAKLDKAIVAETEGKTDIATKYRKAAEALKNKGADQIMEMSLEAIKEAIESAEEAYHKAKHTTITVAAPLWAEFEKKESPITESFSQTREDAISLLEELRISTNSLFLNKLKNASDAWENQKKTWASDSHRTSSITIRDHRIAFTQAAEEFKKNPSAVTAKKAKTALSMLKKDITPLFGLNLVKDTKHTYWKLENAMDNVVRGMISSSHSPLENAVFKSVIAIFTTPMSAVLAAETLLTSDKEESAAKATETVRFFAAPIMTVNDHALYARTDASGIAAAADSITEEKMKSAGAWAKELANEMAELAELVSQEVQKQGYLK